MNPLRSWGDEHGAVVVFVIGLAPALLLVAGLVFDGGQILAARREAYALADNAARAGAQAVDLDALRAGKPVIQPATAEAAARSYLERFGWEGAVVVTGDTVRVRVSQAVPLAVLKMVGMQARTVGGTGEARIVRGVREPGD